MSNYFEIIQNISKDYNGKAPTLFTDISNKKYTQIIQEINKVLKDFMLSSYHRFRRKSTNLSTVIGQQRYIHIYDTIDEMILNDSDGNKYFLTYKTDYKEFLRQTPSSGMPTEYTIFDNKIYLNTLPDAVYNIQILYLTRNYTKGVYTIDQSSASGQKNLYLASTTGLSIGNSLTIEANTDREEIVIIDTITTGDYITATTNLVYTHASGTAEYYKKTFDYETDEPNFPEDYHDIIEYSALARLYFDDIAAKTKFMQLYKDMVKTITVESRQTTDEKPHFKIV